MATALQGFRFTARSCQCRPYAQRCLSESIGRRRTFAIASPRFADSESPNPLSTRRSTKKPSFDRLQAWIRPDHEQDRQGLQRIKTLADDPDLEPEDLDGIHADLTEDISEHFKAGDAGPPQHVQKKKLKQTFLNMGDPEPFEDDNFEFEADTYEDLSSLAHGELERHRELRHYARLAAWEMPLLSKYAQPFVPPTADTPLRFRYTTYMGEQHPAEKKVVMEFCTLDMPNLTSVQRMKLIKLAGVRYNPETDVVRMSCEMFPSQAQNKRYLGDLVNDMLREAKDPKDTFEDLPVDLRHHRIKIKPKFPKEWVMTEQRREELAKIREKTEAREQRQLLTGQLVDGMKQIEEAWAKRPAPPPLLPEMAMAGGKATKGKGKRLAVRR